MSQNSDGDDEASYSVSSDNTGENLLIRKKVPASQSYFVEHFSPNDEGPRSNAMGSNTVNTCAETSPKRITESISVRNSLLEERKITPRASQTNSQIRLSQLSKGTVTSNESNQQDPSSPNSSRTVSTSVLLNGGEEDNSYSNDKAKLETTDERRISTFMPPLILKEVSSTVMQKKDSMTSTKTKNYKFEEAVQLLEKEAKYHDIQTSFTNPVLQEDDFQPQQYNIIKKASNASLRIDTDIGQSTPPPKRRENATHSPSLLNKILVPSSNYDAEIEIPALRSVSGSAHASPNVATLEGFKPVSPVMPERARLAKITRVTDSQIDVAVDLLQVYKNDMNAHSYKVDLEANTGSLSSTGHSRKISSAHPSIRPVPIQHISTASIHSFDSQKLQFYEIYSIPRIIGILICCFIVPTLFFMISVGKKGGISDYRLMRMIINRKHRVGKLKGFEWNIDIDWFRNMCLVLGAVEVLGILASIGSGIGVAIKRQSSG